MNKLNELKTINASIANWIAVYYADLPDHTNFLDVMTPHAAVHQIASAHRGLGAAFYRLVEMAAKECLNTRMAQR